MKVIDLINPQLRLNKVKNQIVFSEKDENSLLQEVRITKIPDETDAFSLDKKVDLNSNESRKLINEFVNSEIAYVNKRCDAVVIFQKDTELHILICEMKSEKPDPQKYEYQLQNVGVFMQYLIDLYLKFTNKKLELKTFKYILFYREKSKRVINKEKIVFEPTKKFTLSKMNNFDDEIIKYQCKTKLFNFAKFDEFING